MHYDVLTIQNLRKEKNPTDELLTLWSQHNHTVNELFVLLSKMQHYRSMVPLSHFVDKKFHRLLHNGEANLRNISRNKTTKDLKIGTQNFNQHVSPPQIVNKILNQPNQPKAQLATSPSNSNNLLVPSPVAAAALLPPSSNTDSNDKKINEPPLPKAEATLPHASYRELVSATNGWNQRNILGKGGFGTVYRGMYLH